MIVWYEFYSMQPTCIIIIFFYKNNVCIISKLRVIKTTLNSFKLLICLIYLYLICSSSVYKYAIRIMFLYDCYLADVPLNVFIYLTNQLNNRSNIIISVIIALTWFMYMLLNQSTMKTSIHDKLLRKFIMSNILNSVI